MIVTIAKQFKFDAAHHIDTLPEGHKCRGMHGHTYTVELVFTGPVDGRGFLVDYDDIRVAWQPFHELLDHKVLNEVDPSSVLAVAPSTENLAFWIWQRAMAIDPPGVWLHLATVRIYESSTTWCEMHRSGYAPEPM